MTASASAGLLERAVCYAAGAVGDVTSGLLSRPTPCAGWDLEMLLTHVNESLAALREGAVGGEVRLFPPPSPLEAGPAAHLVRTFRGRAADLLRASDGADCHQPVLIAERSITLSTLTAAGAIEVAVHGWDVSQACGRCLPIPDALASDLLDLCVLLVPRAGRHPMFAPPAPVLPAATHSDRLVAYLGRIPLRSGER